MSFNNENERPIDQASQSEEQKQPERRRVHSLLFSPKLQLKYGMYYLGIGLAAIIVANFFLIYFMVQVVNLGNSYDPGTQVGHLVLRTLQNNIQSLAFGSTVICFLMLGFALVMTKHVVGPVHALLKHIEELKKGNYSHKTQLRRRDELKPLMMALNELSDTLKERFKNKSA